jgi:hypothetical protein
MAISPTFVLSTFFETRMKFCILVALSKLEQPDILWGDEIFGRHALLSRGWG